LHSVGCKLYRDDAQARFLHEEHHLIAWNGRSDLLVDR
jgi:hypothetical protein